MAKLNVVTPNNEVTIRTESGETVTYRKSNRTYEEAVVGDIVQHNANGFDYLPYGSFYEVVTGKDDDSGVIDEEGDFLTLDDDFEVYEKVTEDKTERSDVITIEGRQYRKAKRPAAVGERILIIGLENGSVGGAYYRIGDAAVVEYIGNVDVLADFKGNEYVRNAGRWYVGHDDYVVLEPITEESAEPAEPARIPVGTYVKVTNGDDLPNGAIAKITVDDGNDGYWPYKCELLDGSDYDWLEADQFEVLSEADAKTAVEAEAERVKWAAIGREVNEYKVGDVVVNVGWARAGYGEVTEECNGRYRVAYSNPAYNTCLETVDIISLVTPVEQRFDRQTDGVLH